MSVKKQTKTQRREYKRGRDTMVETGPGQFVNRELLDVIPRDRREVGTAKDAMYSLDETRRRVATGRGVPRIARTGLAPEYSNAKRRLVYSFERGKPVYRWDIEPGSDAQRSEVNMVIWRKEWSDFQKATGQSPWWTTDAKPTTRHSFAPATHAKAQQEEVGTDAELIARICAQYNARPAKEGVRIIRGSTQPTMETV